MWHSLAPATLSEPRRVWVPWGQKVHLSLSFLSLPQSQGAAGKCLWSYTRVCSSTSASQVGVNACLLLRGHAVHPGLKKQASFSLQLPRSHAP